MAFPITINTSGLTFPLFIIPGHSSDFQDGSLSPVVNLPAGPHSFQQASGYYADFQFEVTTAGTVDYDPKFDAFLSGRGTSTLTVGGFTIELDISALSHGLLPLIAGANDFLMPDTVHRLVLPPASFYSFVAGSGLVASFIFGVDLAGHVVIDPKYAGFAEGVGSQRLTIRGYPIRIDGRRLTHGLLPLMLRRNDDFLSQTEVHSLTLIPAESYGFQPGSGVVADMSFAVDLNGLLDYPASCDGFLSGRGSDRLTLLGYPVLVDATQADTDLIGLVDIAQNAQAPRFLLGVLLPAPGYRLQSQNGVFMNGFKLDRDGNVTVDPSVAGQMVVSTVPRVEVIGATPI
jgi:hypothetical protein